MLRGRVGRSAQAEQALRLLGVGGGHGGVLLERPGLLAGLDLQPVAQAGLLAQNLPGAGDLEALLRTAVRLVLRHGCRALLVASAHAWRRRGSKRPPGWAAAVPSCPGRQAWAVSLRAGLLPATEHDHDFFLVARLEEPLDVALLRAVVVRVDLQPEPDLLQDRVRLVAARLAGLHVRLVLELAEVHELADRGAGQRGDLDQVEVGLLRQLQRLLDADDADLLPVGADQPHLGDADAVVDPGLADVVLLRDVVMTVAHEKGPRARTQEASTQQVRTPRRTAPTRARPAGEDGTTPDRDLTTSPPERGPQGGRD